jgi:dTDP-4-dehydrorhamnose 3,5-epimerase
VSDLQQCQVLESKLHHDFRGNFSKVFSRKQQPPMKSEFRPCEIFSSTSHRGVIRGMHIQKEPNAVSKLVWVTKGVIRDVVLDLRINSETYRCFVVTELTAESGALYVPRGCAHGFEVLSDEAITNYAQDGDHAPTDYTGVRWDSFGFDWLIDDPIVSERDCKLPPLSDFDSRFSMVDSR